jgi:hypothetical protein
MQETDLKNGRQYRSHPVLARPNDEARFQSSFRLFRCRRHMYNVLLHTFTLYHLPHMEVHVAGMVLKSTKLFIIVILYIETYVLSEFWTGLVAQSVM